MMAAPFWEMADSPKETHSRQGFSATRTILTLWADRSTIAAQLMGSANTTGAVNALQYPGLSSVRCARVDVAPLTNDVTSQVLATIDGDLNSYESYAVLTAKYQTLEPVDPDLPVSGDEGTYFSYRLGISAEGLVLPGVGMKWASDAPGKSPQEQDLTVTITIPIQEHFLTWHRVLNPPKKTFRDLIGSVNEAKYLGAATGTLLFSGATLDAEWAFEGDFDDIRQAYRVNLTFKERRIMDGGAAIGWNYAWRSLPEGSRGWQEIENGNGEPAYRSGDFGRLTETIDPEPPPAAEE
jgi:hypothetical protein